MPYRSIHIDIIGLKFFLTFHAANKIGDTFG